MTATVIPAPFLLSFRAERSEAEESRALARQTPIFTPRHPNPFLSRHSRESGNPREGHAPTIAYSVKP